MPRLGWDQEAPTRLKSAGNRPAAGEDRRGRQGVCWNIIGGFPDFKGFLKEQHKEAGTASLFFTRSL